VYGDDNDDDDVMMMMIRLELFVNLKCQTIIIILSVM